MSSAEMTTIEIERMPMDKAFIVDGNEQLCHATGIMVDFHDGSGSWNEYIDSNGDLHYER